MKFCLYHTSFKRGHRKCKRMIPVYFSLLLYEARYPILSIEGQNLRPHPFLIFHLEVDICMELPM